MNWPRIIYHATDGKTRADDGKYTYQRCESQAEFDMLVGFGWVLTPDNIGVKMDKPSDVKIAVLRPNLECVVESEESPNAQAPEAAAETTAPAPMQAPALATKKKKTAKKASRRKAA